jgi:putative transposase
MIETGTSNWNVFCTCYSHVVECPKCRGKVLVQAIATRLKDIIATVCQEHLAEVEELEVRPDPVHLLMSVYPQFGIQRLVTLIRGRSSRLLCQGFPALKWKLPPLWTNSSVGAQPAVLR